MNLLTEVQKLATKQIKRKIPAIKPGLTVRVHQKIKEGNKERVQVFEGLVIKVNSGHAADKTFTVRKVVSGIGVEKIFPIYSPRIEKIEVKKISKVRRAKLYYMRERAGKSARLKENFVSEEDMEKNLEHDAPAEPEPQQEESQEEVAQETVEAPAEEAKEEAPAEEAKEEAPAEEAKEEAPEEAKKEEEEK